MGYTTNKSLVLKTEICNFNIIEKYFKIGKISAKTRSKKSLHTYLYSTKRHTRRKVAATKSRMWPKVISTKRFSSIFPYMGCGCSSNTCMMDSLRSILKESFKILQLNVFRDNESFLNKEDKDKEALLNVTFLKQTPFNTDRRRRMAGYSQSSHYLKP